MRLEGLHHVTAITGDSPGNVEFYAGVLGLRMVKKTVNQDDPTVYHLFYADERGDPGSDITFFEYPGIPSGRAGAGMVHRVVWRVSGHDALDFWEQRLNAHGTESHRSVDGVRFADPEGLEHELRVVETNDAPLTAEHPDIPQGMALHGFDGVCAYTSDGDASRSLLEDALGFKPASEESWEVRGEHRGAFYAYDTPPARGGLQGAGSVHHVAWSAPMEDHAAWRDRVAKYGARPTEIIDRFYFRSIYFREPSGVLFEIATIGPGFAADEPMEHLGERLSLPPNYEQYRDRVEKALTQLPNPRAAARS
ncbi:MAG: VOC family protein [Actinobacteria bacterium]|nr:VOC family protein [Actinomycetota bacterium]